MPNTVLAENIPAEMKAAPRWLLWRLEMHAGKPTKVPYQTRTPSELASTTAAKTWAAFDETMKAFEQGKGDGIGFVLGDGWAGVDLDDAIHNGKVDPWAQGILNTLYSYTERSPRGMGLHILMRGMLPDGRRGIHQKPIEVYDQGRYFTVTGQMLPAYSSVVSSDDGGLILLVEELDLRRDFLEWARSRKIRDKVENLLKGDTGGYSSPSEADLALASFLGTWARGDQDRMIKVLRLSRLWDEKWERDDYQTRTFAKALESLPARTPRSPEEFSLTDEGNARRLIALYGQDLLFCQTWESWLIWDQHRWKRDTTLGIERRAVDTVKSLYDEAKGGDQKQAEALAKHAVKSESDGLIRAVINRARAEAEVVVVPAQFDANPWMLNVLNGVLNLQTAQMYPHRREDFHTRVIPAVYDPLAKSEMWDAFLTTAIPNEHTRRWLQKAVGYSLTGKMGEDMFFFLYGIPLTGKTTFIEAIASTWGTGDDGYARTASLETFLRKKEAHGARPDLAELPGKRLVKTTEISKGRHLDEELVKAITGGDELTTRNIYEHEFSFFPTCKLWFAANNAPVVSAYNEGLWRRMVRVPFDHKFDNPDPNIRERLKDPTISGAAILAWAVEGALAWQREGLRPLPEEVQKSTETYKREMDVFESFFADRLLFGPRHECASKTLREAYELWCVENGERPAGNRDLYTALRARACTTDRGTGGERRWLGVGHGEGR